MGGLKRKCYNCIMEKVEEERLKNIIKRLKEIKVKLIEQRDKKELEKLDKMMKEVKNGQPR